MADQSEQSFSEESLDDVFNRLRRAAGPNFINPLREDRLNPPTETTQKEALIVYLEHVALEKRLRRARLRREAWAKFKRNVRQFIYHCIKAVKAFVNIGD